MRNPVALSLCLLVAVRTLKHQHYNRLPSLSVSNKQSLSVCCKMKAAGYELGVFVHSYPIEQNGRLLDGSQSCLSSWGVCVREVFPGLQKPPVALMIDSSVPAFGPTNNSNELNKTWQFVGS